MDTTHHMDATLASWLEEAARKLETGETTEDCFNEFSAVKSPPINAEENAVAVMRRVAELLRTREKRMRDGAIDGEGNPAWL